MWLQNATFNPGGTQLKSMKFHQDWIWPNNCYTLECCVNLHWPVLKEFVNVHYFVETSLGTKSKVLNVDNPDLEKYPLFMKARRYECSLEAGDVLFIPGKWQIAPAHIIFNSFILWILISMCELYICNSPCNSNVWHFAYDQNYTLFWLNVHIF